MVLHSELVHPSMRETLYEKIKKMRISTGKREIILMIIKAFFSSKKRKEAMQNSVNAFATK